MKNFHSTLFRLLLMAGLLPQISLAQIDTSFESLSIEELLKVKVSVASAGEALSQRESPGIITLITKDEIRNSGARDLMDVLRMVPGIEFGQDVIGAVGLIVRGAWAQEGKVLLLIDGQEMNELAYNSLPLGNRYNVDQIERVEVIRGPGSARYGGFAELGVINIVTKQAQELKGGQITGLYSTTVNGMIRSNVSLSAGKMLTKDIGFSIHSTIGQGNRSDQTYTSLSGESYQLKGNASTNPAYVNAKLNYKGLQLTLIQDNYTASFRHYGGVLLQTAYTSKQAGTHADLRYKWEISKKLSITPRLNFRRFDPYNMTQPAAAGEHSVYTFLYGNTPVSRAYGGVNLTYNHSRALNISGAVEYTNDVAQFDTRTSPRRTFWNGLSEVSFTNIDAWAQLLAQTKYAHITIGGRIDHHNIYGTIAAPRFAVTRAFNRLHIKVLASGAYRVPAPQNIAGSAIVDGVPSILPEKTFVTEIEMGYRFGKNLSVQGNAFLGQTREAITFDANGFVFRNGGTTGTGGAEIEVRYKDNWGYATINYSYYTASLPVSLNGGVPFTNTIGTYATLNERMLMGSAPHKVSFNAAYRFNRELVISPSGTFLSGKYAYTSLNASGNPAMELLKPTFLANLYVLYSGLLKHKLSVGVGGYNLLNSNYAFVQTYNSGDAPIRTAGREFLLKLSYNFGL